MRNKKDKNIPLLPSPPEKITRFLTLTENKKIDKAIIDSLDSEIILLDNNFNILLMNSAAEKTWGVRVKEVKGMNYLSLRLKFREKELVHNLKQVFKAKRPVNIKEMRFISPENATRFLDLSWLPVLDQQGNIQGVLSISRDVTKRVEKEIQTQKMLESLSSDLEVKEKEIRHLQKILKQRYNFHKLIGKNHLMQKIYDLIERVAQTNSTILITGETGTGKELVARAIHYHSLRKEQNLIAVNCAALPETLLESELFGHVKGSFTGAIRDKKGKFELADQGTLFLDEIGELSIPTQVKLLRALQEKEIERVGDEKKIKVDIRIIAATNKELSELIKQEKFRKDLYYRLNVISLRIPPLRERLDDLPLLVNHFLKKFNRKFKKNISRLAQSVLKKLMSYSWPGNVRELEAVIEKAVLLADSGIIQDIDLTFNKLETLPVPGEEIQLIPYSQLLDYLAEYERDYFILLFKKFAGRINRIAEFTGLNRRSILNKMKKYRIKKNDFK